MRRFELSVKAPRKSGVSTMLAVLTGDLPPGCKVHIIEDGKILSEEAMKRMYRESDLADMEPFELFISVNQ